MTYFCRQFMNMYQISKATIEDCPAMLALIRELAVFEKAPDEVTVSLEHFETSGFGPNPVWWAFVVRHEDVVVGMALYYVRYSTWKGQRMYLEDIIVTEQHRNRGIGSLLMDALQEEARTKGFHGISWQVLDWNEAAIAFYKKYDANFDPEWINVSITV